MASESTIDYDSASRSYDNTRSASVGLIEQFNRKVTFSAGTTVLDFGCGTGNYLDTIQRTYGSRCYGVEPSVGMREKAKAKNRELIIEEGDHGRIPFEAGFFDFSYMTDVIHHVPDMAAMFGELRRVLKTGAKLCIVTESHAQIDARFYNRYFPSIATNEKKRYPDIGEIQRVAVRHRFSSLEVEMLARAVAGVVSAALVRTVEEKNYSMFRQLDQSEYVIGLEKLRGDLGKTHDASAMGGSLIWLEKM